MNDLRDSDSRIEALVSLLSGTERTIVPSSAQFSLAGEWEHAWAFDRAHLPALDELAARYHTGEALAFEAFLNRAFIGIRCENTLMPFQRFVESCLESFVTASDASTFLRCLERRFTELRLGGRLAFIEVGAVNAWKSVTPFRIKTPVRRSSKHDQWRALTRSTVARDRVHVKAIEFSFNGPFAHWVGVPASSAAEPFAIDVEVFNSALTACSKFQC